MYAFVSADATRGQWPYEYNLNYDHGVFFRLCITR